MGNYDQFLRVNLGGGDAQLEDYSLSCEPVVKEGTGRTGTRVRIEGDGWIEAGRSTGALAAAISAAVASLDVSGQDVVVSEWNGAIVVALRAAQCIDGGPHINYQLKRILDGAALVKKFSFSAEGVRKLDGKDKPGDPADTFKVTTAYGPDGMRQVDVAGELTGAGAMAFFLAVVLPRFEAQYPLAQWVEAHRVELNDAGDHANYSFTFGELLKPLPGANNDYAVDGEETIHRERDEQQRLLTHYAYDLLVVGNPQAVLDAVRPVPADTILRESSEVTVHKGLRLRAEFVVLSSGSGNDLLNFEQSFSRSRGDQTAQAMTYPGVKPFLVNDPPQATKYVQRGRAVGYRKFPKAPDPILATLSAAPVVTQAHVNQWEKETTWEYQMISVAAVDVDVTKLMRPDKPTF